MRGLVRKHEELRAQRLLSLNGGAWQKLRFGCHFEGFERFRALFRAEHGWNVALFSW